MSQALVEGEEKEQEEPKLEISLRESDDKLESYTWVAKGSKRQKIVHMLARVKERTMILILGKIRYFAKVRHGALKDKIIAIEFSYRAKTNYYKA